MVDMVAKEGREGWLDHRIANLRERSQPQSNYLSQTSEANQSTNSLWYTAWQGEEQYDQCMNVGLL